MSDVGIQGDTLRRIERRERRDFAIRVKHGLQVITTVSYAVLAGALWKPLFEQTRFTILGVEAAAAAICAIAASFYFAPQGEFDAQR